MRGRKTFLKKVEGVLKQVERGIEMAKNQKKIKAKLLALTFGSSPEAPEWIQLLPMGETVANGERFIVDDQAIQEMIQDFSQRENDAVLDYEHQTFDGVEAPAAGWIVELEGREDGLWGRVEWTDRGRGYVEAKEYRYISPVMYVRETDSRCYCLLNAALTNHPAIDGMTPVAAKENEGGTEMELLQRLIEMLGLAPEATEEDVVGAVAELQGAGGGEITQEELEIAITEAVEEAVGDTLESVEEVLAAVDEALDSGDKAVAAKAKSKLKKITAKSTGKVDPSKYHKKESSAEKELKKFKAEMAVDKAIQDGKLTPAQKTGAIQLAMKDHGSFEMMMKSAPKVVALREEVAGGGIKTGVRISATQEEVNRKMGLKQEDFEKYGGKQ